MRHRISRAQRRLSATRARDSTLSNKIARFSLICNTFTRDKLILNPRISNEEHGKGFVQR